MVTTIIDKNGIPGMPTFNIRKVRRLLKGKRAVIAGHRPFTVRLLYADFSGPATKQDIEICQDTGYSHIGISVKSEKHEFFHEQYDLLEDEKQRHDSRRRNRRNRRSRKRYRKPRFDNRKKEDGWLAPSIRNKLEQHASLIERYAGAVPVSSAVIEMGSFDTQLLEALEKGCPLPEGTDYQHGKRYGIETLREAVFYRDGYKCLVCGKEGVPLRVHHIGYWKEPSDHTDRMGNLASVCAGCHVAKAHKKGGKLYGWEPEIRPLTGAAYMNAVRWRLKGILEKEGIPVKVTYGAMTRTKRHELGLPKTHANDAYSMGQFHPAHRAGEKRYRKVRRNNRILEKFCDAKYVDIRDGSIKSGSELSSGRTNRKIPRNNPGNERGYRGAKASKGRRSIRRKRYGIRPGDILCIKGKRIVCGGVNNEGKNVTYHAPKEVPKEETSPVKNKKTGESLPVKEGGLILYKGKKRKILRTGEKTVTIDWQYAAGIKGVKVIRHTGGWIAEA